MLYIFDTKDGCSLQLEHRSITKSTVHLVGNKLVYKTVAQKMNNLKWDSNF